MGFSTVLRRVRVIVLAALCASLLLLSLGSGARGDARTPNAGKDPAGNPYVAGELLVAYKPGTSENAEQAVVRGSGGRTARHLSGEIRLV